jgi:hypothetical protein
LAGHKEKRKQNQNVVASERKKKKTRKNFQIIGRAFRMAMTANTKIFYSTINQAALDQRLYFLRTHRHLSLSLHLLFERNPKERREEDAERK